MRGILLVDETVVEKVVVMAVWMAVQTGAKQVELKGSPMVDRME